jgi:WD40 repeat protein/type II secretory pathway predicted ATPase ExeA
VVQQIYPKLDVHTRHQAIERAQQLNLLGEPSTLRVASRTQDDRRSAIPGQATAEPELVNPYKGLRAFQEADAAAFFGRTALTGQLLARLTENDVNARFLAVVGPSGSGKSSVVRAGLIAALRRGEVLDSSQWFVTEMLPGAYPLEELEAALLRVATKPQAGLRAQLSEDRRGLMRVVKRLLPADQDVELVLVIDQFEEVFTLVEDEAVRGHFIDSLVMAVTDPRSRIRVVVTLRADFYDRPLRYAQLAELMRKRTEIVVPLTPSDLEQAITGPAKRAELTLEPGLPATIISDVSAQPGALPLLQYALTELFMNRTGRTLTLNAYLSNGGISGALARRADSLYEALDAEGQATARQMFLRLVALGEGIEDTSRRVQRTELLSMTKNRNALDEIIDAYTKYCLLSLDYDPVTRVATIELAHEALIRTWERLRHWIDADRQNIKLQRLLTDETIDWLNAERDPDYLAAGTRLLQFETLGAQDTITLNEQEKAFLAASVQAREGQRAEAEAQREQRLQLARKSANRLRYLLVIAVGLLAVTVYFAVRAQLSFQRAESERLAAEAYGILRVNGDPEVAALLSIRALGTQYTSVADTALQQASEYDYGRILFKGHTAGVTSVAFSPGGRYALTGSADKTARLWDVTSGKEIRQFLGHADAVLSVAFSPDGRYVLTGSADKIVQLWDMATGQKVRQFLGHTDSVASVAFSPDGKYVLTGSGRAVTSSADRTARLWDVTTGLEVRRFTGHTDGVLSAVFSPDGKWIVTASHDKTVRLWDVATGQELRQFTGHTDYINSVAFSPDGRFILTASDDNSARLWDVNTQAMVLRFADTLPIRSVAFSHDGRWALMASQEGTARLWDVSSKAEPRAFIGHTDWLGAVRFSPDGKYLVTSSVDQTARLWDVASGKELKQFEGHQDSIYSAVFSSNSQQLLTGSYDHTAILWDVKTGQVLQRFIGHTDGVNSAVFSPNGEHVLTGSSDKTAILWDIQTALIVRRFTGHKGSISAAVFAPDGTTIITGSADMTARQWDVKTGLVIRQFVGHEDAITWLAISPDGKSLVTVSQDKTARLWDISSGSMVYILRGHKDAIWSVTFSPDGKYFATASQDKTVRLWDTTTGNLVRVLGGHNDVVIDVAFSPDGKYLVTASQDRTARLWAVDYHELINYVCARLLRDFTDSERDQYQIEDHKPTCP